MTNTEICEDRTATDTAVPVERDGVVAVLDALGFAALVERHSSYNLFQVLQKLRQRSDTGATLASLFEGLAIDSMAFSDTLVVTCTTNHPNEALDLERALYLMADHVGHILTTSLAFSPPLNFRGSISVGRVLVAEGIAVGAAVNDAAKFHERATAAAVWLTPKTLELCRTLGLELKPWFYPWSVPQQEGSSAVDSLVLNPLWSQVQAHGTRYVDSLVQKYLAPFGASEDARVQTKRANTVALLERAREFSVDDCSDCPQNLWAPTQENEDTDV